MLRATLRSKSFAMSLLVHGSVFGAALVMVGRLPSPGGGRTMSFQVAAYEPVETYEPATELPQEELEVDDTLELPPALVVTTEPPDVMSELEPLPVLPSFEDPSAPFAGLPHDLDLRARKALTAPTPPSPPPLEVAEVTPIEPAPASTPRAAEPAPTEPAPGQGSAVSASSPTPLAGATPKPDYPASWARRGWVGEVTIELDVAADGSVSAARVVASSGFPRLDELARETLATWRFAPAEARGAPVSGTFRQRVEFRAR
jgi:protein TonB